MMTLYARREPTTDSLCPSKKDVCLYRDAEGTQRVARHPWHYSSTPDRRYKWIMHNCSRYRLLWLDN